MKKLLAIILMLIMLVPCAYAETIQENPNHYSGYWLDSWSRRAHMTITFDGEKHNIVIHWANSAFDSVQWEMSGRFENGVLHAQDCVKTNRFYSEDGSEQIDVLYANEESSLTLNDGVFTWTDPEKMGAECRFERYEQVDMRDVYNPEHYSHMYVTDIYSSEDGVLYCQGALGVIHENGVSEGFDLTHMLTLPLSPAHTSRLPSSLANEAALELTADPAAWFEAHAGKELTGFYAVFSLNESGEIVKLAYSEDQPDAPVMPEEKEEIIIAPAPPTRR